MSKIVTIHTDSVFTPSVINPSYQVGNHSNITSTTFEVSDITMTNIRDVIGAPALDVKGLCSSGLVNKGALFRPDGTSPYSMGDFAGYDHFAKPQTYFYTKQTSAITRELNSLKKITIAFLLKRGQRPPQLDNSLKNWGRIRLSVVMTGDHAATETTDVSVLAGTAGYDAVFTLPSNDFFTLTCQPSAIYLSPSLNSAGNIEDTHPSFTVNVKPKVTLVEILKASGAQYAGHLHYHVNGGGYAFRNTFGIPQVDNNTGTPTKGYMRDMFFDPIGDGSMYSFTIVRIASKYYRLQPKWVDNGESYKEGETWYEISTDAPTHPYGNAAGHSLAFMVDDFYEVPGYYAIVNGRINQSTFTY